MSNNTPPTATGGYATHLGCGRQVTTIDNELVTSRHAPNATLPNTLDAPCVDFPRFDCHGATQQNIAAPLTTNTHSVGFCHRGWACFGGAGVAGLAGFLFIQATISAAVAVLAAVGW